MGQTIFYPDLNEFCRMYLDANRPVTSADATQFSKRLEDQNAALFEQFLLFDKISFKVYGENILVPYLISQLGQKTFESLVEQRALDFRLWTPVLTYLLTDVPGVVALQSGTQSSPSHSDPEASLELGLKWMRPQLYRKERRQLVRKLLPLCKVTAPDLSARAVQFTVSAFGSGKLDAMGFDTRGKDIQNLPLPERKALCKYATDLLEYSFLIENRMTSYSNLAFFSAFDQSAEKVEGEPSLPAAFNRLAKIENFPDLKTLYRELEDPFKRVSQLRGKRATAAFRSWLSEANVISPKDEITKEYIDSITGEAGFFETKAGKVTKSIVMTSLGAGIGAWVGGMEGALGGAVAGKVLETGADLGLDLLDDFLLEKILKGWTPRMYFEDLRAIRTQSSKAPQQEPWRSNS